MKILLACLGIAILILAVYFVLTTIIDDLKHPDLYLDDLLAEVDYQKSSAGALLIIDPFEQDPLLEERLKREAIAQDSSPNEYINQYNKLIQSAKEKFTYYGFDIIDRSKMDLVMKEMEFQTSYWSNEEKTIAFGKSLNADFIVTFSYVLPSSVGQTILSSSKKELTLSINVMDVKTHSTHVYSSDDISSISLSINRDSSSAFPTEFRGVRWFFDGIKKSSYKYKGSAVNYITPFASSYPLKDSKLGSYKNQVGKLSYIEFHDSYANLCYTNGEVKRGTYWFEESIAEVIRLSKDNASAINVGKSYSTFKLGSIAIRDDKGSLIAEGTLFYYKSKLGILVDSKSKNVSFMMFGR